MTDVVQRDANGNMTESDYPMITRLPLGADVEQIHSQHSQKTENITGTNCVPAILDC